MNSIEEKLLNLTVERASALPVVARVPPELLSLIFTYLHSTKEQHAFLLTCRLWFSSAVEAVWFRPVLHQQALEKFLGTVSADLDSLTLPYGNLVRRLNFTSVADGLNDEALLKVLSCQRLERLTLASCNQLTDESVVAMIESNPGLQSVDLSGLEHITDEVVLALADNCKKLQGVYASGCLQLTDKSVAQLAQNCSLLKRIKLNNVVKLTDAGVGELVANCRHLIEVDLAGCTAITNNLATRAFQELSQLREFRLAHNMNIGDVAFRNLDLESSFERLRVIDLTQCVLISDESIQRLVNAAPRLRNVVLAKCGNVGDAGVSALTRLGKCLHYLHLGHCSNITDRSIASLVKYCPRIQYVDVACCTQLTNNAVKELATLPKLRRIGLVKCQNITDAAIYALAQRPLLTHKRGLDRQQQQVQEQLWEQHGIVQQRLQLEQIQLRQQQLREAAAQGEHEGDEDHNNRLRQFLADMENDLQQQHHRQQQQQQQQQQLQAGEPAAAPMMVPISYPRDESLPVNTLERVHLSYCTNISVFAITELVNSCERLMHLSLTGVPPFIRADFTQFCRPPPQEFTQHQQSVFCVFSGKGVSDLRTHLNALMANHWMDGVTAGLGGNAPENDDQEDEGDDGAMDNQEVVLVDAEDENEVEEIVDEEEGDHAMD